MPTLRYTLIVVVIFLAGFLAGQSFQPQTVQQSNLATVPAVKDTQVFLSIETEPGKVIFSPLDFTAGQNLMTVTQQLAAKNNLNWVTKDYGSMGVLVTQIGDKKNGDQNKYWQYWINKQQVQTAANAYILRPNDVIEWRFSTSQF
ncbi:MAG: DUF4430 domain-containing protein [Candidatus Komeilibacteria bacterium]